MKLTAAQFEAVTRYHFGVAPKPKGVPHISVADLGRVEFERVTGWWHQFDQWMLWVDGGKKGPRPPVWKTIPAFAWELRKAVVKARPHPLPPPPEPPKPPVPPLPPSAARYQNVAVGAWGPMDALAWPGCKIWFSADPAESLSKFVTRANADHCRSQGHDVGCWYVPDQVSHDRARQVADILGTDIIVADCETLHRFQLAAESGVRAGIFNLSAVAPDPDAYAMLARGEFICVSEHYWNQSRRRQPDNHNLPVVSICIAVYDGHSDSQEPDAWEPHIADYKAAGYLWPSVSVYQQNMTSADWALLP